MRNSWKERIPKRREEFPKEGIQGRDSGNGFSEGEGFRERFPRNEEFLWGFRIPGKEGFPREGKGFREWIRGMDSHGSSELPWDLSRINPGFSNPSGTQAGNPDPADPEADPDPDDPDPDDPAVPPCRKL